MAAFAISRSRLARALRDTRSARCIFCWLHDKQNRFSVNYRHTIERRYNVSLFSKRADKRNGFMSEVGSQYCLFSSNDLPTHNVLEMPALSPTMDKGNIASWKKKEGDKIEAGDVICEIETDKATLDFESLEEGFLAKILVSSGSKDVPVGQPLAILVDNEEDVPKFSSFKIDQSPDAQNMGNAKADYSPPVGEVNKQTQSYRFGPAVRRLLAEFEIDLSKLKSTGPRGILLKGDVLAAMQSGNVSAQRSETASTQQITELPVSNKKSQRGLSALSLEPSNVPLPSSEFYDDVPNTQIRKVIAKRLWESKHGTPHIYLSSNVILDPLLDLRREIQEKHGLKISVNDIIIKVVALALKAVPEANAYWSDEKEGAVPCSSVDISIAVATDKGLMTPIIRNANLRSLSVISAEVKELADKARHGKLNPSEFQGGTFSISNLGMFPVDQFSAVINPPQAGILAVGRGNRVVCWKEDSSGNGKPSIVTEVALTLSADQRVINHEVGERFLNALTTNFKDIRRLLL
eukprot:TRINITY_DN31539_c0_g1_i1.p1 TRINITY_DN31539_c0_g1~~TRINITY_DN31539_c0_g1_i1.p1  ORF type:complete len:520 (+),score=108.37 TRINITY_DN31539_c0_g1_i1:170-1729(+)